MDSFGSLAERLLVLTEKLLESLEIAYLQDKKHRAGRDAAKIAVLAVKTAYAAIEHAVRYEPK